MRLCLDKTDPGYRPPEELARFCILFNGEVQTQCHTADEEKGFIRILYQKRPAPWLPPSIKVGAPIKGKVEIKPK